jgi:hypothetical protein
MNIDWDNAPEGATHATPSGTFIREERGDRFVAYWEWLYEWVLIESGLEKDQLIERPKKPLTQAVYRWAKILENGDAVAGRKYEHKETLLRIGSGYDTTDWQNSLIERPKKRLTQAVFEGLPSEYRWAGVEASGKAYACICELIPKQTWLFSKDAKSAIRFVGDGYDTTNWQNSLIERQDVLTAADIDWSKAPEGATHYSKRFGEYYKAEDGFLLNYLADESRWIVLIDWSISALESPHFEMIKRTESITDVARSIEEARQVEKDAVNNPSHYTTGGIECIDAMQAMLSREEFIGYLRGNVFKYQWRYKHKNGIEDLKKAQWYANRLIELESAK